MMTDSDFDERQARLELLVGQLSDILSSAKDLVGVLRLQANASTTTRGKLETLNGLAGLVWEMLGRVEQEVKAINHQESSNARHSDHPR
jgi:hypothetical protein